jgi:hypothetical protein
LTVEKSIRDSVTTSDKDDKILAVIIDMKIKLDKIGEIKISNRLGKRKGRGIN